MLDQNISLKAACENVVGIVLSVVVLSFLKAYNPVNSYKAPAIFSHPKFAMITGPGPSNSRAQQSTAGIEVNGSFKRQKTREQEPNSYSGSDILSPQDPCNLMPPSSAQLLAVKQGQLNAFQQRKVELEKSAKDVAQARTLVTNGLLKPTIKQDIIDSYLEEGLPNPYESVTPETFTGLPEVVKDSLQVMPNFNPSLDFQGFISSQENPSTNGYTPHSVTETIYDTEHIRQFFPKAVDPDFVNDNSAYGLGHENANSTDGSNYENDNSSYGSGVEELDPYEPGHPMTNLLGEEAEPNACKLAECIGNLVLKEVDVLERLQIANNQIQRLESEIAAISSNPSNRNA